MPKHKSRWNVLWCCNPFGLERHSKRVCKRKVTSHMCKKVPHLVVGDAICDSCRLKISKMSINIRKEDNDNETEAGKSTSEEERKSTSEEDYVPESTEDVVSNLNKLLTPLGESPVSKHKLSRLKCYAQRKASAATQAINEMLNVSTDTDYGQEMIKQFKEKYATVKSAYEKYRILTCLPKSWSEYKIISEFQVSPYVAHVAKTTQAEKGIMSVPDRKYRRNIPDDTVKLVRSFYEDDEISRIMAGMKDTKSVKEGHTKIKKQKRLLLANLKELYKEFKSRYPNCKIGFSRFSSLRPRHCVLAGAPGTHNVCVCAICENTKLMIMSLQKLKHQSDNSMENLDDLIQKMICSEPTQNCYLGVCQDCPGDEALSELLQSFLENNLIEEIMYKKWTKTDRAEMVLVRTSSQNFVNKLGL